MLDFISGGRKCYQERFSWFHCLPLHTNTYHVHDICTHIPSQIIGVLISIGLICVVTKSKEQTVV